MLTWRPQARLGRQQAPAQTQPAQSQPAQSPDWGAFEAWTWTHGGATCVPHQIDPRPFVVMHSSPCGTRRTTACVSIVGPYRTGNGWEILEDLTHRSMPDRCQADFGEFGAAPAEVSAEPHKAESFEHFVFVRSRSSRAEASWILLVT